MQYPNLIGKSFNRLTVIGNGHKKYSVQCRCECGSVKPIDVSNLISGKSRSCGCLRVEIGRANRTHGKSETRSFHILEAIKQRCNNPNNPAYHYYGGRGIRLCEDWYSFEKFIADMGEPPSEKHTIDRINSDGNYEPSNCRWATMQDQGNNRRSSVFVNIDGENRTIAQWLRHLGVSRKPYNKYWGRGMNHEQIIRQIIADTAQA